MRSIQFTQLSVKRDVKHYHKRDVKLYHKEIKPLDLESDGRIRLGRNTCLSPIIHTPTSRAL